MEQASWSEYRPGQVFSGTIGRTTGGTAASISELLSAPARQLWHAPPSSGRTQDHGSRVKPSRDYRGWFELGTPAPDKASHRCNDFLLFGPGSAHTVQKSLMEAG